jgi:hypothetical protein
MGDFERFRKGIWTIALAGGGLKSASMGWLAGTHYEDALHFDLAQIHQEFMMRVPFWEMEPSDHLVSRGYAMADPGEQYVVYLPDGGSVSVNLQGTSEPLQVEWLATETGEVIYAPAVEGGEWTEFDAPDSDAWVLYLHGNPVAGVGTESLGEGISLALHPSSPNPAHGRTMISFVLPQAGRVNLTVFDLLGRRISRIYQRNPLDAGAHQVEVDVSRFSPGSYFYRLDASGESIARKLFVVR